MPSLTNEFAEASSSGMAGRAEVLAEVTALSVQLTVLLMMEGITGVLVMINWVQFFRIIIIYSSFETLQSISVEMQVKAHT